MPNILKGFRMVGSKVIGPVIAANDPYFNYTTLLLPGSGSNGANNNVFVDASTNNFAITRNGNATQGTFSPFSQTGWGNYFNGSSTYLQINTTSATLAFGTGDFTIEGWFYFTSTPQVVTNPSIISSQNGTGFIGWRPNTTGIEVFTPNVGAAVASDAFTIPINQWIHMAVVRESSSMSFYMDGVRQGAAKSNTNNYAAPTSEIIIGRTGSGGPVISGYISNLRVTKGRAVYSGSTYTVPTVPLTRTTGGTNPPQGTECSLLTCQSNGFLDSNGVNVPASSPFTIIANNSPTVIAFSPFAPAAAWSAATYGGSGYFDGTGDYLSIADNDAFALGSNDWTIECWVYISTLSAQGFIAQIASNGADTSMGFGLGINASGYPYVASYINGAYTAATASTAIVTNQWNHIAGSRASGTMGVFLNGSRLASTAVSGSSVNSTNIVTVGSSNSGASALTTGYISGARIVNGTAVYSGTTYTVPTAPLTAIANTSLLLNFTNAGIYDATGKNNLETVGDVKISTAQSKFGGSSIIIDNADRLGTKKLVLRNNYSLDFGTGDFTIEAWIYLINLSTGNNQAIIASGYGGVVFVVQHSTNVLLIGNYGGNTITGSTALSAGQWYHVAATRSSGTTRLFLNGNATVTSSTSLGSLVTSSNINVGQDPVQNLDQAFNGYIQDLRVTKGYARYTANFTPTTAVFPVL